MTEGVIGSERQSSNLLGKANLQAGVTAVGVGAELIHAGEALVERSLVRKGRKAALADRLVAIELHLIRLVHAPSADVIHAQSAAAADLLFDPKIVFVKVGRLQRAAGERVHIHSEWAGWCAGCDANTRVRV